MTGICKWVYIFFADFTLISIYFFPMCHLIFNYILSNQYLLIQF